MCMNHLVHEHGIIIIIIIIISFLIPPAPRPFTSGLLKALAANQYLIPTPLSGMFTQCREPHAQAETGGLRGQACDLAALRSTYGT